MTQLTKKEEGQIINATQANIDAIDQLIKNVLRADMEEKAMYAEVVFNKNPDTEQIMALFYLEEQEKKELNTEHKEVAEGAQLTVPIGPNNDFQFKNIEVENLRGAALNWNNLFNKMWQKNGDKIKAKKKNLVQTLEHEGGQEDLLGVLNHDGFDELIGAHFLLRELEGQNLDMKQDSSTATLPQVPMRTRMLGELKALLRASSNEVEDSIKPSQAVKVNRCARAFEAAINLESNYLREQVLDAYQGRSNQTGSFRLQTKNERAKEITLNSNKDQSKDTPFKTRPDTKG